LISTWVLASARKRFLFYQSLLWALGTLFFPLIVLPLYFVALLVIKRETTTGRRAPKDRTWRFSLPLLYAAVVLCSIGIYIYRDTRSVDAHLSRANHDRIHDE